jgi:hypothetical protein
MIASPYFSYKPLMKNSLVSAAAMVVYSVPIDFDVDFANGCGRGVSAPGSRDLGFRGQREVSVSVWNVREDSSQFRNF